MVRKINKYNKNKEKKQKEKEEKIEESSKKQEKKPFFNWKAFGIAVVSSIISVILFPMLLSLFGVPQKVGIFIGNTFLTSFAFAWIRSFVDTEEGFGREFLKRYATFIVIFGCISYVLFLRGN